VRPRLHSLTAAVPLLLWMAVSVHAQTPPPSRQGQGLFGGARPDAAANTRVDFTASLVEGYDDDVPTSLLQTIDPFALQTGGFSSILSTGGAYVWKTARTEVGLVGTSVVRHYADVGETRGVGSSFGAGISTRLPGHFTLLANQAGTYTPTYLSGLFPTGVTVAAGSPGETAPDYTVNDLQSYTYSSTLSLRRDFSSRTSFVASGDFQFTDRREETELWQDVSAHWLRGEFSRNVTRNTALNAQYRYRSGAFGYTNDLQTIEHALDFGVNYSRPLSATRRATVRMNVGVSGADVPQSVEGGGNKIVREYLGNGFVSFEYQFQQSWQARANYRRGIEYVVDIPEPVFADSWGGSVEGFLSRRVDLALFAGYSSGKSLLTTSALAYDTYTGSFRVRYALSRLVATHVEYLYYFYDFAAGTPLLIGIPPGLERQGVRVGLTLWMPAFRR